MQTKQRRWHKRKRRTKEQQTYTTKTRIQTPQPQSLLSIMGITASFTKNIPCFDPFNQSQDDHPYRQQHELRSQNSTPFFSCSGNPHDDLLQNISTYHTNSPTPSITAPEARPTIRSIPFMTSPAEYVPGHQSLPVVQAICIARTTNPGNFPSVYLYDQKSLNPVVHSPMELRIRETGAREDENIQGRIIGIRSINLTSVEFWLTCRTKGVFQPAYLIVPLNRASLSRVQTQAYVSNQLWIPRTIETPARYQAAMEYARGHYRNVQGGSSSAPNLVSEELFSPLEVPIPAHHRTVRPQHSLRRL